MAGICDSGYRRALRCATESLCVVGVAFCCGGGQLWAQHKPVTVILEDVPTPTLHVYQNILQASVLVLQPNRDRIGKPIDAERFSVSLDAGPWFRAAHVRREGDDPISLSILLDVSGDGGLMMPKMAEAIAALAPESLRPQDRVSVYVLDCSLIKAASDVPPDLATLKRSVKMVLSSWTARNSNKHAKGGVESDCKQPDYLWDAVAELTDVSQELPGRRVILLVSGGEDKGSAHTWNQVRADAQEADVAIFGLKYAPDLTSGNGTITDSSMNAPKRAPFLSPMRLSLMWCWIRKTRSLTFVN